MLEKLWNMFQVVNKDTMSLRRHSTFNTGFVYILHYYLVFLLIGLNR